jgi:hypothetical protein
LAIRKTDSLKVYNEPGLSNGSASTAIQNHVDDPSMADREHQPQSPPDAKHDRQTSDELAEKLTKVPFQSLPADLPAGMRFTTPSVLSERGITRYSVQQITALIRQGLIPARRVLNQYLLEPEGVERLLERERQRLMPGVPHAGRRPGRVTP